MKKIVLSAAIAGILSVQAFADGFSFSRIFGDSKSIEANVGSTFVDSERVNSTYMGVTGEVFYDVSLNGSIGLGGSIGTQKNRYSKTEKGSAGTKEVYLAGRLQVTESVFLKGGVGRMEIDADGEDISGTFVGGSANVFLSPKEGRGVYVGVGAKWIISANSDIAKVDGKAVSKLTLNIGAEF